MFQIWKLFPKLYFGLDDLNPVGGAPEGQPTEEDDGNAPVPTADPDPKTPTDVELEGGVKVPKSVLDKWAQDAYKDRFEAYDNREKWQAENTRKAQENAQALRDAEAYRRLMAEQSQKTEPVDPQYEAQKAQYVAKKMKQFPTVDPSFFEANFDDLYEVENRAQGYVEPLRRQQGEAFESRFLQDHPKVQKGTPQYLEIAQLMGSGVDAEKAYQIVFHDDILKEKTEAAIKQRDEEAKRKLKQSRTQSTPASTGKLKGRDVFEKNWEKFADK